MYSLHKEGESLAIELVKRTPKDAKEYKARKKLLDQIMEKLAEEESADNNDSEK